jgi:hypothetical protein
MCYFIIVQMAAICLYTLCAAEFLARYHFNKPVRRSRTAVTEKDGEKDGQEIPVTETTRRRKMDARVKLMLLGLVLSTLFIFIRSIYRTIELLDGWTGRIITTEVYFVCVLHLLHIKLILFAERTRWSGNCPLYVFDQLPASRVPFTRRCNYLRSETKA